MIKIKGLNKIEISAGPSLKDAIKAELTRQLREIIEERKRAVNVFYKRHPLRPEAAAIRAVDGGKFERLMDTLSRMSEALADAGLLSLEDATEKSFADLKEIAPEIVNKYFDETQGQD